MSRCAQDACARLGNVSHASVTPARYIAVVINRLPRSHSQHPGKVPTVAIHPIPCDFGQLPLAAAGHCRLKLLTGPLRRMLIPANKRFTDRRCTAGPSVQINVEPSYPNKRSLYITDCQIRLACGAGNPRNSPRRKLTCSFVTNHNHKLLLQIIFHSALKMNASVLAL